jgi:hypothetical protein
MIKPLIVRDRPPALEPTAPPIADEEPAAPVDDTAAPTAAPEVEPVVPQDIPQLAALPDETPTLPQPEERSPIPSAVREALKSRFDVAYGSPNRIDLLAPVRQTRRFDPSRFDIFDDPPGG